MARTLLLFLVIIFIAAAVWSIVRARNGRRNLSGEYKDVTPLPKPPAELAAPAQGVPSSRDIFRKLHELSLGGAAIAANIPAEHAPVVAAVRATFEGDIGQIRNAPRRPQLLPQLLRAVNDEETSSRELSNLIARDPALAGNLLQFANSPLYRVNAQPVESVDRAVALLGFDGIRSLIAAALIQPVFRIAGGEFTAYPETVWEHTFRSASAAEAHAAIIENSDPFAAQLIALVMGLAAIIVFRATLEEYAARRPLRPEPTVIASLLDAHTAQVARRIADDWELSGRILAALEDQVPDLGMNKPASLGRSLRFGRLLGALSLLHAHRVLDEDDAKKVMAEAGAAGPQVDRIWARLTQQRA